MKKRRLAYWVCHHLNDRACYAYRARTRAECVLFLNDIAEGEWRQENFSKPMKVVVEYENAFDLVLQCLGEGGLIPEAKTK